MDTETPTGDNWDNQRQDLIATARRDFAFFYRAATEADAVLMDDLVIAHAILVLTTSASREHIPEQIHLHFEKTTDAVERLFTHFREAVRASPTFAGLSPGEQLMIERVIFDVRPVGREMDGS